MKSVNFHAVKMNNMLQIKNRKCEDVVEKGSKNKVHFIINLATSVWNSHKRNITIKCKNKKIATGNVVIMKFVRSNYYFKIVRQKHGSGIYLMDLFSTFWQSFRWYWHFRHHKLTGNDNRWLLPAPHHKIVIKLVVNWICWSFKQVDVWANSLRSARAQSDVGLWSQLICKYILGIRRPFCRRHHIFHRIFVLLTYLQKWNLKPVTDTRVIEIGYRVLKQVMLQIIYDHPLYMSAIHKGESQALMTVSIWWLWSCALYGGVRPNVPLSQLPPPQFTN